MTLIEFQQKFGTEEACLTHLEESQWGKEGVGRFCPHCSYTHTYQFKDGRLYKCAGCKKQFTAKVGTCFSDSHIPLVKWYLAVHLMLTLKKGISSVQLAKYLGVRQATAWFMMARIRETMGNSGNARMLREIVESDEHYQGGHEKNKHYGKRVEGTQGFGSIKTKAPIIGMLQRKGDVRLVATPDTRKATLHNTLRQHVAIGTMLMSDEYIPYQSVRKLGLIGVRVNHGAGEYARGNISTNGIENVWSHFSRGIKAIQIHVSPKHLQLYCNEYQYRFNRREMDDYSRFEDWFGSVRKRTTYRQVTASK